MADPPQAKAEHDHFLRNVPLQRDRVHLVDSLDCLFAYGERWRGEASAGLRALGLNPPANLDARQ